MRILYINNFFKQKAGTELIAINTYELFKKKGHEVYFFGSQSEEYYEQNNKLIKFFPVNVNSTVDYIKNPLKYYWNFEAANKLQEVINIIKPEVIHIHSSMTPSVLYVCKRNKIPTCMTVHIPPYVCPAATFMYKNKQLCKDLKCKNGNYLNCILNKCGNGSIERSIRKSILSYLYDKTNVHSAISYFICPSNALRDYVRQTNICENKNKIITINNFLTKEESNTTPNYENNGYFLYLGRLSEEKGLHYLLQALNDLPKNIKLHIVGSGSKEKELKNYTLEHNLENVEFLGFKNREEIKEEYQNCIATILPCNWFEIFGMSNIESFINGKPVIASNIGGIPEIVENNINGLLFESANVEQLKKCILTYWNNPELVKEHGRNGYKKARTQYTAERYYKELMQVYKNILKEKNEV